MKRNLWITILLLEALLCLALSFIRMSWPEIMTSVLAFPFEQIGYLLRTLSLSGSVGNVIAIVCYVLLSLLPILFLVAVCRRRRFSPEDILLALASLLLFIVLYYMINPALLKTMFQMEEFQQLGKAMLGTSVYAILVGYLFLRALRHFFSADRHSLQKYLGALLIIFSMVLVYIIFGASVETLLNHFTELYQGNTEPSTARTFSVVFLLLGWIVDVLPYLLNLILVYAGMELLRALANDRYSDAAVMSAARLANLCGVTLVIMIVTNIGFNLLNLFFSKQLLIVNTAIQIPFLSILFTLAVLLLAQFIRDNKRLKDDNDLFI